MHRSLLVLAACSTTCSALQFPSLPRATAVAALISSAAPLPAIAAMPSTKEITDAPLTTLFLRDPTDIYYGIIAAGFLLVVAKNFVGDTLANAKEIDEAKASSNKQMTDAFKQARDKK